MSTQDEPRAQVVGLVLTPVINDGRDPEEQPDLIETASVGIVRVQVGDATLHAEYRLEVSAYPAGHDGFEGMDTLRVSVWRVTEDASSDLDVTVGLAPEEIEPLGDEYTIIAAFKPRIGRMLPHRVVGDRTRCVAGCSLVEGEDEDEDVEFEGLEAGDTCPDCGKSPVESVLKLDPEGRTWCPLPCSIDLYDGGEHPVGSECPCCKEYARRGEMLPNPMEAFQDDESDSDEE